MNEKKIYIKDIKENNQIEGLFLIRDKNNGMTKNGKPYIALTLVDKTGEVKGRIWDNAEKLGSLFAQGDIVKAKAYSVLYQGALQLNINSIEKFTDTAVYVEEFLPASKIDTEETFAELMTYVNNISNIHLKHLLEIVFSDEVSVQAFKKAPAAKTIHHDYIGGLIEHTLNVTKLASDISEHYPNVNREILVTGAILHDIGKIYELSFEKNFDYSDKGRLVGHITLGDELVNKKIKELIDFPEDLAIVIRHMILSHHGQY